MIDHLLTKSIIWRSNTGKRNDYGKPVFGPEVTVKVRLEKTSKVEKKEFSDKLVIKAELFSTTNIGVQDKLIFDGNEWEVLAADSATTASGDVIYFLEAYSHGKG